MHRKAGIGPRDLPVFPAVSCSGAQTPPWSAAFMPAWRDGRLPVIGGTINYYRVSTGGEPGGFIAATVGGTQQRYIMSPDSRDGDRTSYVGGMLRYDVKIPEPASPPNSCITRDDVQIDNGTGNYAAWSCGIDPDSTWTS